MITTNGMNHHPALKYCHDAPEPEKFMFATDCRYRVELSEASASTNSVPMAVAELEKITRVGAKGVLHVPAA
jgi:hypothetical protein